MANENFPLSYKGHPLRRKDNLIYYGTMAEKRQFDLLRNHGGEVYYYASGSVHQEPGRSVHGG